MSRDARLLLGPLAGVIFLVGLLLLPPFIPGYDSVRQTVSEIGEMDSPMRWPFAILLIAMAGCFVGFSLGVTDALKRAGRPGWGAWLIGLIAVPLAGIAVCAFPNLLHNVFGLSELIPYQAPWVFALAWTGAPDGRRIAVFSWVMAAVVWLAIGLNLTAVLRAGPIWAAIKPTYGLYQRALFLSWFVWAAGLGLMLWRRGSARG